MKNRTITMTQRDILFEVDVQTDAVASQQDPKVANELRTYSEEANHKRLLTRFMDTAFVRLHLQLERFVESVLKTSATDEISPDNYVMIINLTVEDEFRDELLMPIAQQMHDYVVKSVLADWYMSIGNGGLASGYLQQLPTDLITILALACSRPTPSIVS